MMQNSETQSSGGASDALDTDFLKKLPKVVDDLRDRWYIVRQRGFRPQDVMDVRGITRALVSGLTGSAMDDSFTTARRIDERLAQYAATTVRPNPADLETIGALVLRLRESVRGEVPLAAYDAETAAPAPTIQRPLVCLFGADASPENETALLLGIHGYAVVACADEAALPHPGDATPPDVMIAELAAMDDAELSRLVHLRDGSLPGVPLVILAPVSGGEAGQAELHVLRAGADALLKRPVTDLDLVGAIRGLVQDDFLTPYRVLMLGADAGSVEEPASMLRQAGLEVGISVDPLEVVDRVADSRPEAVVIAGSLPGVTAEEIGRLLLPHDMSLDIPLLALGVPGAPDGSPGNGMIDYLPPASTDADIVCRVRARAAWHRRIRSRAHGQAELGRAPTLVHPLEFERLVLCHLDGLDPAQGAAVVLQWAFDDPGALLARLGPIDYQQTRNQFVRRIREAMAPGDLVVSHGEAGLIAIAQRKDVKEIVELAQRVHEQTAGAAVSGLPGGTVAASIGVGQVMWERPLKALDRAIALCSEARDSGGNRVQLDPELLTPDLEVEERNHWRRTIAHAIKEKRLFPVFQPIANISGSDQIERHEVLLRIREPNGKILLPGQFVEMAERLELDRHLDRWVISNALGILNARTVSHPQSRLFVKMSRGSLGDSSFLPWLGKQLAVHPVWPGSLVLQLREGDVLGRMDQLSAFGDALRDLEIRIALEHFGASTDADTRRMLAEMRPDYVKIARELTVGLHHSATPSLRLNGLLGQAKEVGAYTMASYVEDADGLALLWQAQIDLVQGNFIRQPEEELRYELEFPGLDDAG